MKAKHNKMLAMGILVASLVTLAPSPGRADDFDLTLSSVSGQPGSTVTVDGTITNNGPTTLYLNSEDFTLASPSFLNGDVTDFFLNAPLSLAGGTDSGLIPLFAFDIAPGTPLGQYPGNFLDILGGPGPSDQNILASAEFSVTVTPEPGSFSLMCIALLVSFLLVGTGALRRE